MMSGSGRRSRRSAAALGKIGLLPNPTNPMSAVPPSPLYLPASRKQRFCSQCGHALTQRVPEDDNRLRDVCDHCKTVHYQNPLMVVGTMPVWQDKILLCRRAIEPRFNYWTLPAGFMELGESSQDGAARETREEAGAEFTMGELFAVIDIPHVDQVHVFYHAKLTSDRFDPGPESLEAALFAYQDIPWDALSFRSVALALELFFEDRQQGRHGTYQRTLAPLPFPPIAVAAQ